MKIIHCDNCGGMGKVDINKCKNPGCLVYHSPNYITCFKCDGTGHLIGMEVEK